MGLSIVPAVVPSDISLPHVLYFDQFFFALQCRIRGNLEWAPPRPQIIFHVHNAPRWADSFLVNRNDLNVVFLSLSFATFLVSHLDQVCLCSVVRFSSPVFLFPVFSLSFSRFHNVLRLLFPVPCSLFPVGIFIFVCVGAVRYGAVRCGAVRCGVVWCGGVYPIRIMLVRHHELLNNYVDWSSWCGCESYERYNAGHVLQGWHPHVKILFFVLPFSSSGEKFLWLNRITDAADVECG